MSERISLSTPQGELNLHVCKDGSTENDEWIRLYQQAFPDDERQSVDEIKLCLTEGSMELDETRDEHDRILCMTITEVFRPRHHHPPFLLACYTAVDQEFRGVGIGSVHRRRLADLLHSEYSHYLGIFTEIESTKVSGLPAEVMDIRQRRKRFFLKLGLVPIDIDYYFPSTIPGAEPIAGELLWVPFEQSSTVSQDQLCSILERVYISGYGLRADDPFIARMLSQFKTANL